MSRKSSTGQPQKRSGCVTLVLVGTVAGICGLGLYACTREEEVTDEEVTYVSSGTSYPNNHYVSGVGYYHAPFHTWFPIRYNDYDPARGHYHGGNWHPAAHTSGLTSSTPDPAATAQVNRQWRAANPSEVSSRKSAISSSRSTSRGGFGSFFRGGSS